MQKPRFFLFKIILIFQLIFQINICKKKKIVGILSLSTNTIAQKIERKYSESFFHLKSLMLDEYLDNYSSFVSSDYQDWLSRVSITIVPIDINMDIEQILKRIKMLNGLLLTGGAANFYERTEYKKEKSEYLIKVKQIVNYVKEINKNKKVFPLWATCLGFEALLITESNFKLTRSKIYNHDKVIVPINIYNYKTESAQFFSINELKEMQQKKIFYFHHVWAINQKNFEAIKELDQYKIVANFENEGQKFITWVEHRDYPIYGTQFHPELMANHNINSHNESQFYRFYINQKLALLFKKHLTNFDGNYRKNVQETNGYRFC